MHQLHRFSLSRTSVRHLYGDYFFSLVDPREDVNLNISDARRSPPAESVSARIEMELQPKLGPRPWSDYNRRLWDRQQILCTDAWSRLLTTTLTVAITLASPYIFELIFAWLIYSRLRPIYVNYRKRRRNYRRLQDRVGGSVESLHDSHTSDRNEYGSINPILPDGATTQPEPVERTPALGRGSRQTILSFLRAIIHGEVKQPPDYLFISAIVTLLVGLFIVQSTAGYFTASVASDKVGLVDSEQCGIWQFDEEAGHDLADLNNLYNYEKEARASQYAQHCYGSQQITSPFSCQLFYNQSIKFNTLKDYRCPFESPEMCLNGLYSAVKFDTGLVDASVIGVNARPTHKFRRSTTCSPLNMSETYIQKVQDANETAFNYYYGPKGSSDSTYETTGRPFDWLVPVYLVDIYFSSLYPDQDYWHPLPELEHEEDSTLTIIFVSSLHIYHTQPSHDPIFPATEERHKLFVNSDPRARPWACVDKTELCSPDGRQCWSMKDSVPQGVSSPPSYWLMKWSLENSNIQKSIKWRLGSALIAQRLISQSISRPLNPDQWQTEASQLFATSLARIQYDALAIAGGEDHEKPGYIDATPPEGKGRLCGMMKFKTTDYININLAWCIFVLCFIVTLNVLTWSRRWFLIIFTCGLRKVQSRHDDDGRGDLMIDWIVDSTAASIAYLGRKGVKVFRKRKDRKEDDSDEDHDPDPRDQNRNQDQQDLPDESGNQSQ